MGEHFRLAKSWPSTWGDEQQVYFGWDIAGIQGAGMGGWCHMKALETMQKCSDLIF